jgi:transcription elongation factor GreA
MAKQNDFYLTKEGLAELEAELKDLKGNKRKEVATALKEAKEFGDLSENTDWDDAKSRQLFIEGRISELENILKHAKVIEGGATDSVGVGSTVEVELENDRHTFRMNHRSAKP